MHVCGTRCIYLYLRNSQLTTMCSWKLRHEWQYHNHKISMIDTFSTNMVPIKQLRLVLGYWGVKSRQSAWNYGYFTAWEFQHHYHGESADEWGPVSEWYPRLMSLLSVTFCTLQLSVGWHEGSGITGVICIEGNDMSSPPQKNYRFQGVRYIGCESKMLCNE